MIIVESLNSAITEEGKERKYIYRLIKRKFRQGHAYGIEVERQDFTNGNVVNIERERIETISNSRNKVYELLKMLNRNQVSPIHLVEILGEYVDEYIYDFDNLGNQQVVV